MALVDWARPGGQSPPLRAWVGILVGFLGVALLFSGSKTMVKNSSTGPLQITGLLAILVASLSWAGGSIFLRQCQRPHSVWMNVAAQMICGGIFLTVIGWILGEHQRFQWATVSSRSIGAFWFLIVFGSWIGFGTFNWLLHVSTPTRVSTYAYVNPVVAVFLGWAFAQEPVTQLTLLSAAITLVGVALITMPNLLVFPRLQAAVRGRAA